MLLPRVIPCLQLSKGGLVKTRKFKNPAYVGDPINTIRIFNELEVDELCVVDIRASKENYEPDILLLTKMAKEAFMPLSYGGGITSVDQGMKILANGFEKLIFNTIAFTNPNIIESAAKKFGSSSVIGSIDVKKNWLKGESAYSCCGTVKEKRTLIDHARFLESIGVGEILLTSIDHEGTRIGLDIELINNVSNSVNVPVIAHGGCDGTDDIRKVFNETNATAIAIGHSVVYQSLEGGVLVNFPDKKELFEIVSQAGIKNS